MLVTRYPCYEKMRTPCNDECMGFVKLGRVDDDVRSYSAPIVAISCHPYIFFLCFCDVLTCLCPFPLINYFPSFLC
jgi:hypothetical protein